MAKYNVEIIETLSRVVEQEANSYDDAEKIVQDMYDNCEYVLDYNDLENTDFKQYPYPKIKNDFNVNINIKFDVKNSRLLINNNNEFRCENNNDLLRAFENFIDKNIALENGKEKKSDLYIKNDNKDILKIAKDYDDALLNDDEIMNEDDGVRVQYILVDDNKNVKEVISFGYSDIYDINPKTYEKTYIHDYVYDVDSFLFEKLEEGLSIGYMTLANHYDVWLHLSNNYENIIHKDGLQKYLDYCKENNITNDLINREIGVNIPDIYELCNKKTEREER